MILGVLMYAKDVPLGSTVTKRTGAKEYTISDQVRIFHADQKTKPTVIPAVDGARFIASGTDFNAVAPETVLVWIVEPEALAEYLEFGSEGEISQ
jgi:hypothetical protein